MIVEQAGARLPDDDPSGHLPHPGDPPRAPRRGHLPPGLPVEAAGGARAGGDAGDEAEQHAAAEEHTARPRRRALPVPGPAARGA